MGVSIIASMNAASNIKRAGGNPARHYKFNRFYPANKTHCKYTAFFVHRNGSDIFLGNYRFNKQSYKKERQDG